MTPTEAIYEDIKTGKNSGDPYVCSVQRLPSVVINVKVT
jgi:hypothetical protein